MDWSDLLEELLHLIQGNLFGIDRHTFSLVCRNWNKVVYTQSPCLVFCSRGSNNWKVFQQNSFFFKEFPKLDKHAAIRCSKHGWLLLSWDSGKLLFFHPFDNLKIEVPDILDVDNYSTISFFDPPTSRNCFIIGINIGDGFHWEIGLLKHGEDKWKVYEFERRTEFCISLAQPILHDGKLYFLGVRGNIATIDMSDVKSLYVQRNCLKHRRLHKDVKEHFLVKPNGEDTIFAIFVIHNSRKVRVLKLSKDNLWEPVEDLGDRVFYVSNFSSFGYKTHNKSMTNKIFFHKFHGDKVVFYSLNTKKYHSFEGDYSSENSYDFIRFEHAAWIMEEPTPQVSEKLLTWCSEEDPPAT